MLGEGRRRHRRRWRWLLVFLTLVGVATLATCPATSRSLAAHSLTSLEASTDAARVRMGVPMLGLANLASPRAIFAYGCALGSAHGSLAADRLGPRWWPTQRHWVAATATPLAGS